MDENEKIKTINYLYDKVWGVKNPKFLEFKHYHNPEKLINPVLFHEDDGNVVGMNGFLGMKMVVNSEIYTVAQSCDSAVLPEARGKGVFSNIQKKAEQELYEEGVDMLIGVPNDQSAPGFDKLGWEQIGKFNTCILPLKCGNALKIPLLSSIINLVSYGYFCAFNRGTKNLESCYDLEELHVYLNEKICRNQVFFSRSIDSLKWKTNEETNLKYVSFKSHDKIVGVVIYYIKHNRFGKTCFISEYEFEAGYERSCLSELSRIVDSDCFITLMVNDSEKKIWKHSGFFVMKKKTSLIMKNLHLTEEIAENVRNQKSWRIREFDLDTILNQK